MIVVAGLGPAGPEMIPAVTWDWVERAAEIYVRTGRHPAVDGLSARGIVFSSLDDLYEREGSFDRVYEAMARTLIDRAVEVSPVVLLVPGSPHVAEETVRILRRLCPDRGVELEVEAAPSFLDLTFKTLEIDPTHGVQVLDAYRILDGKMPAPDLGLVVSQVHSQLVAGDVKLRLLDVYDPDHPVTVLRRLGIDNEVEALPLCRLDHGQGFDHLTSLYLPPQGGGGAGVAQRSRRFYQVMSALLGEGGCPWDRRQTHRSLRPFMIEECYEAVACMDGGDPARLAEELGDVLLQVYLHAGIGEKSGQFTLTDVIESITAKMVRRHPHVFGAVNVDGAEEVLANWETIKREEKGRRTGAPSLLDDVPGDLPALMQALKVQERAARMGFDWPDASGPRDKLLEEIRELDAARSPGEAESELGDVLFSVVNWARFLRVVPELALRGAVSRFAARFADMEEAAGERGVDMGGMSLEEMDCLWDEVKEKRRGKKDISPGHRT